MGRKVNAVLELTTRGAVVVKLTNIVLFKIGSNGRAIKLAQMRPQRGTKCEK